MHAIFAEPSLAIVLISYLLKNPEHLRFSGVFRDYEMETLNKKGLSLFGILHHISEPLWNDEIKFEPQVFVRWELGTKEYDKLIQSLDGKSIHMRCFFALWYYLYNFKNMKNTHCGVLLSVKF